jgi:hypothetical protein
VDHGVVSRWQAPQVREVGKGLLGTVARGEVTGGFLGGCGLDIEGREASQEGDDNSP